MSPHYSTTFRNLPPLTAGSPNGTSEPPKVFVEFLSPSQLNAYEPPPGLVLAGDNHLVRGSVPRCVFVLQSASDEVTETRVVWTCCKNNDGALGPRSAWERANGRFQPVNDFDWQAFDFPEAGKEAGITQAQVAAVFQDGQLELP